VFKRLEEIEVWKRGCRLTVDLFKLTSNNSFEREWGMRDQIRRAAASIPANVAEGFERESNAEFKRFLMIARGSCGELRTHIYISEAVGLMTKEEARRLIAECIEVSSMLTGLAKSLSHVKPNKTLTP